ncbi:hypothetical protein K438DRAFT_1971930 [Mycena galopus ATCC 62051]|nr:hypothetical protein K438DRAFT_1971930 [Mycena galopus ATCC 62051]
MAACALSLCLSRLSVFMARDSVVIYMTLLFCRLAVLLLRRFLVAPLSSCLWNVVREGILPAAVICESTGAGTPRGKYALTPLSFPFLSFPSSFLLHPPLPSSLIVPLRLFLEVDTALPSPDTRYLIHPLGAPMEAVGTGDGYWRALRVMMLPLASVRGRSVQWAGVRMRALGTKRALASVWARGEAPRRW